MSMVLTHANIWQPASLTDYKVYFARWNGEEQPLHVLARGIGSNGKKHIPTKMISTGPMSFSRANARCERHLDVRRNMGG